MSDIFEKIKLIDQKEAKGFLKECRKEMENFRNKTTISFELAILNSINDINKTFEEIFKKLNKLKESMINGLNNQFVTVQNNFKLIELCIAYVEHEMDEEKIMNFHPSKLPMLLEFFKENQSFKFHVPAGDFNLSLIKNQKLEEIKNVLNDEHLYEKHMMLKNEEDWEIKIKKQNNSIFNFDEINFSCDVQNNLLSATPILIDEGTFFPYLLKANVSTSFILDNETFLIWPGYKEDEGYFIHIYNLSTMKKELIVKGAETDSILSVLSHYPKQKLYKDSQIFNSNKSFVYWADTSGVFTILGLSKQDKFKEIIKIYSPIDESITSIVVFEDLYSEIIPSQINQSNKDLYAILSFEDEDAPLLMYKIDGENQAGEIIKEIVNPCQQYCRSMNFYYNEELCKCFIVCGFKGSVKIYDIALGQWLPKEFKTKLAGVSSLEILQRKVKVKSSSQFEINYYLFVGLLSKNNNLMFCNLSTMNIISTISIPNSESVRDVSIFVNDVENVKNKELALIACKHFNSIKLVTNFEDLKILDFSKDTGIFDAVNVRKVLVKDKNDGILKEHLVVLQWGGEKNQVLYY